MLWIFDKFRTGWGLATSSTDILSLKVNKIFFTFLRWSLIKQHFPFASHLLLVYFTMWLKITFFVYFLYFVTCTWKLKHQAFYIQAQFTIAKFQSFMKDKVHWELIVVNKCLFSSPYVASACALLTVVSQNSLRWSSKIRRDWEYKKACCRQKAQSFLNSQQSRKNFTGTGKFLCLPIADIKICT